MLHHPEVNTEEETSVLKTVTFYKKKLIFIHLVNRTKLRSGGEEISFVNIWFDIGISWNRVLD